MASNGPIRRCAVYTRKSSEEGLQQEFNSLDAQREAGVAYIRSQAGEGWRLVETHYDDGGISGGTLERPALQRLMADIAAGKIQVVVVYKVDRLTRSLGDFAKLVEVFESGGVSFVSVTQQFNTTTSMGRLMLNVLLSFAQFEREVTGERIRDKIAASKKKGMWMGGTPPMGYEVADRKLVVCEQDAETVRYIYRRYLDLGCITLLARELARDGYRTRRYQSAAGVVTGGRPFSRGHLHRILTNRTYIGEIEHRGNCYPGEHEAIVHADMWGGAQARLAENRNGKRKAGTSEQGALLRGLVFDDAGHRMMPMQGTKGVRRYRYYVSRAAHEGRREEAGSIARVPAAELEEAVLSAVEGAFGDQRVGGCAASERAEARLPRERWGLLYERVHRVTVGRDRLQILVRRLPRHGDLDGLATESVAGMETVDVPFRMERRSGSVRILTAGGSGTTTPVPDVALIKALVRGYDWARRLLAEQGCSLAQIAREEGVTARYVSRLVRYAFLAPDVTEAVLSGLQPARLTVDTLKESIPLEWAKQRTMLGVGARVSV